MQTQLKAAGCPDTHTDEIAKAAAKAGISVASVLAIIAILQRYQTAIMADVTQLWQIALEVIAALKATP